MSRHQPDYFAKGDYNAICDRCGGKRKASQLRKDWQGFMLCTTCWEPRHPQDYVRAKVERVGVPWSRPQGPQDAPAYCTFNGMTAIADSGTADCAITDYISPSYDPSTC